MRHLQQSESIKQLDATLVGKFKPVGRGGGGQEGGGTGQCVCFYVWTVRGVSIF